MDFELKIARNKEELLSLMEEKEDYKLLAGGTDLFVKKKKGLISPDRVIDITEVFSEPNMVDTGDDIRINATATHQELATSSFIKKELPVLAQAAEAVGATQLRNMATLGGNVCNASPSADTLIALYLLNAKLTLVNRSGERTITLRDFITGPGSTTLSQAEFLESITIPKLAGNYRHFFEKVGRRNALDISVCSMGYLLKENRGILEEVRLAYGAVAPTVIRPEPVEDFLQGKEPTRDTLDRAKNLLEREISPISDIRGSSEYRKKVALRLLERLGDG